MPALQLRILLILLPPHLPSVIIMLNVQKQWAHRRSILPCEAVQCASCVALCVQCTWASTYYVLRATQRATAVHLQLNPFYTK